MKYEITTHTGSRSDAASDGRVGICLVGALGTSADCWLEHEGRTRFSPGSIDVFTVETPSPLGVLLYVELFVVGKPWFVDRVAVRELESSSGSIFPHYAFVTTERRIAFEATASLPQHDLPQIAQARLRELEKRRATYEVEIPTSGLPPRLREQNFELLPLDEVFSADRTKNFERGQQLAEANVKAAFLRLMFDPWDAPADEQHLYPLLPKPAVATRYAEDSELAWQTVAGVAPNHVRRATSFDSLPKVFRGAKEALDALRGPLGIDAEIQQGRIYFLDDAVLEDIPMFSQDGVDRYAPAGGCLFVAEGKSLRPFAIRTSSDAPIVTPADGDGWLMAKSYLRAAEANIHQVITHAVRTHLAVEPFLLATMRSFSSRHPIYKLMRRHFRGTIRINAEARQLLLARGGVFDEFIATGGPAQGHIQLAAKAYAKFELAQNEPKVDFQARGFGSGDRSIDYPFGDASEDLYARIFEYVETTLATYYDGPASLAGDVELAYFLDEVRKYAKAGGLIDGPGLDVPQLAKLLALVVYTGSVLHAGVNFQQYEHFGFVPNAPATMRVPPPTVIQKTISDAEWMKALPDFPQTARQIAVSYSLSRLLEDDEYLLPPDGGQWKEAYFVEPKARDAINAFHDALRGVKERIMVRNTDRGRDYTCLLPDQVPTSTTI